MTNSNNASSSLVNEIKNATSKAFKNNNSNAVNNAANSIKNNVEGIARKTSNKVSEIANNALSEGSDIAGEVSSEVSSGSWFTPFNIIIGVIVLAFLGFNVLNYFGYITEESVKLLSPILNFLGIKTLDTTQDLVNVTAGGAKNAVDLTAGVATDAINIARPEDKQPTTSDIDTTTTPPPKNDLLDNAVNTIKNKPSSNYEPDYSTSGTQKNLSNQKSGYCFIGSENGIRSCIKVNELSECRSGKIFEHEEVCKNPSLRY